MGLTIAGRAVSWSRIRHRGAVELRRAAKKLTRFGPAPEGRTILFVLGCQRSGTTMLSEVFARDPRSDVYPEKSVLSSREDPDRLRLRPLAEVAGKLARNPAELVVLKPLVESQRAAELLDMEPGCRAIWMFRDYRDVVRSNQRMFGEDNGRRDLAAVLGEPSNWRGGNLSDETRTLLRDVAPDPSEPEAAALFWYARNSLFFRQELDRDARVWLCSYEDYVADPAGEIDLIYRFIGDRAPPQSNTYAISTKSVGAGRETALGTPVAKICDDMLSRLRRARAAQMAALSRVQGSRAD